MGTYGLNMNAFWWVVGEIYPTWETLTYNFEVIQWTGWNHKWTNIRTGRKLYTPWHKAWGIINPWQHHIWNSNVINILCDFIPSISKTNRKWCHRCQRCLVTMYFLYACTFSWCKLTVSSGLRQARWPFNCKIVCHKVVASLLKHAFL